MSCRCARTRRRLSCATTPPAEPREDIQHQVRGKLADVDARIGLLTEAIQIGGALGPLVADLKILTTRREHLLVRLNGGATERRAGIADLRALEAELRGYFAQWTELLRAHAQQARQMLRKLIDGRILVHPRDGEAVLEFRCTAGGVSCSKSGGGPNGIR
jgi:hypothetical protein